MGITGLWPLLEPTARPVSLESLEGKKVAVDVSIWIHQAQSSMDARCPHLALLVSRLCKMIYYKIRPVFVFDGPNVPRFKQRVLDERRARRFAEENGLGRQKRKQLAGLARGETDESSVVAVLQRSPAKRARREEAAMFELRPGPSHEVVDVSDDEVQVVGEKRSQEEEEEEREEREEEERRSKMDHSPIKLGRLGKLIQQRERIKEKRLRPDQVPMDSNDFSRFQLARMLTRGKVSREIEDLRQLQHRGEQGVSVAYEEGRRLHTLVYHKDNDVQIVEDSVARRDIDEVGVRGFGNRTLDHLAAAAVEERDEKDETEERLRLDEEEDVERARLASLAEVSGREYVSKSGLIEELVRKRIGKTTEERVNAHTDGWSSDDEGDDDFIDVPMPGQEEEGKEKSAGTSAEKEKSPEGDALPDCEWDPRLEGEKEREWQRLAAARALEGTQGREEMRDVLGAHKDLQDLLTAVGFPWVESPGEAEAQCAELERLGLVEAVVSDDSDVWAFGARTVYRHLFARGKHVQKYEAKEMLRTTGLTRWQCVQIAVLSGGDYSCGLNGVGVVSALELLAEFANEESGEQEMGGDDVDKTIRVLRRVEEWLLKAEEREREGEPPRGEPTAARRKLRQLVERNNERDDVRGISNPEVVRAYAQPEVDSSTEQFRWRPVSLPHVRQLLHERLGWDEERVQKNTLSAFERWNEFVTGKADYQRHLTSYFEPPREASDGKTGLTKRVQAALARLAERNGHMLPREPASLICQASLVDQPTTSRPSAGRPMRIARKPRAKKAPPPQAPPTELRLSESSDSE